MYELRWISICCFVRLREYLRKSTIVFFVFLSVKAYHHHHHHHRFSISRRSRSMTDCCQSISPSKFLASATPRHACAGRQRSCSLSRDVQPAAACCFDRFRAALHGGPTPHGDGDDQRRVMYNRKLRGLLGPWDAFGQWGALGHPSCGPICDLHPLNAFTSSFRPRRRRRAGILSSTNGVNSRFTL
jgi:hypothetical protein